MGECVDEGVVGTRKNLLYRLVVCLVEAAGQGNKDGTVSELKRRKNKDRN